MLYISWKWFLNFQASRPFVKVKEASNLRQFIFYCFYALSFRVRFNLNSEFSFLNIWRPLLCDNACKNVYFPTWMVTV